MRPVELEFLMHLITGAALRWRKRRDYIRQLGRVEDEYEHGVLSLRLDTRPLEGINLTAGEIADAVHRTERSLAAWSDAATVQMLISGNKSVDLWKAASAYFAYSPRPDLAEVCTAELYDAACVDRSMRKRAIAESY